MPDRISLIGKTFGRLKVIGDAPTRKGRGWSVVQCECGVIKEVRSSHLGRTIFSCGCQYREMMASRITHHMSGTVPYELWAGMLKRCNNPNCHSFVKYGKRGIKVCERWLKFENFYADMTWPRPAGMTLERIDNSGDYSPDNVRWATPKEQARNTRRNRILTVRGITASLVELIEIFGGSYHTIKHRLLRGADPEQAFFQPVRKSKNVKSF